VELLLYTQFMLLQQVVRTSLDLTIRFIQLLVNRNDVLRTFSWGFLSGDSETHSYFDFNLQEAFNGTNMVVAKLWTIPCRNICIVLFESDATVWSPGACSSRRRRRWSVRVCARLLVARRAKIIYSMIHDGGRSLVGRIILVKIQVIPLVNSLLQFDSSLT
jgi:hypothetical protein